MTNRLQYSLKALLATSLALAATQAHAHIGISSGHATAGATQEITFAVGHGCNDGTKPLDSYSVTVNIPAGFTSARPMTSDFGPFTVTKDTSGAVSSVTWTKPQGALRADDAGFYKLVIRLKAPDAPFTVAYFPIRQVCRDASGAEVVVDWVGTPSTPAPEPAASLTIVPARQPGWNKYTPAQAITDLPAFFKDAVIVWQGKSAFSNNPNTTSQIAATSGVTTLARIEAGEDLWVRY